MNIDIEIIKLIIPNGCTILGDESLVFSGMQTIRESLSSDITWISPSIADAEDLINSTKANGVICNQASFKLFKGNIGSKLFLISDDPKSIFVLFVKYISANLNVDKFPLIHSTAVIDKSCVLGSNVKIGAYSVIGACQIGDGTTIGEFVKIHDGVTIGSNCKIREFCSIGGEGFGYLKNSENQNEHIPHIGSVLIEDNVEIFPYSNVDRGTLGKTWIKSGTVIDHYVHIGHNTTTGFNNIIAAGVVLAGGSKIEDDCFIGVHTIVKEKCEIGSNVVSGMGSVVVRNIPANQIWVGNPAKFLKNNQSIDENN